MTDKPTPPPPPPFLGDISRHARNSYMLSVNNPKAKGLDHHLTKLAYLVDPQSNSLKEIWLLRRPTFAQSIAAALALPALENPLAPVAAQREFEVFRVDTYNRVCIIRPLGEDINLDSSGSNSWVMNCIPKANKQISRFKFFGKGVIIGWQKNPTPPYVTHCRMSPNLLLDNVYWINTKDDQIIPASNKTQITWSDSNSTHARIRRIMVDPGPCELQPNNPTT